MSEFEEPETFVVEEPTAPAVPLLVSIPHAGTELPEGLSERMASDAVRQLPDTDFYLHELYNFVPALGARMLRARYSRYVVDLNRAPDGETLYAGRDETRLIPVSSFEREPIYKLGQAPQTREIEERLARFYRPYHLRLAHELSELKRRFGYALLFDAHSIRSRVPRFFAGELPGLMLGDVDGRSCAPAIADAVYRVHRQSGYSQQRNRPFKGGYITRHYGSPAAGVHALQLEMSQRLYMDEAPPFGRRPEGVLALQPVLRSTLETFVTAARTYSL